LTADLAFWFFLFQGHAPLSWAVKQLNASFCIGLLELSQHKLLHISIASLWYGKPNSGVS